MNKLGITALTMALTAGSMTTTFAAANPFSDVPRDNWAYDAVSQLAEDGVIDGYGDNTFRGQQPITRYEMAQMVAKAMAKEDTVSSADKALIDKLAAEYAAELDNLGVRVSNLERNADKLKWGGYVRYTYQSYRHDKNVRQNNQKTRDNSNEVLLRIEPSAEVNDHWHVNFRFDATTEMDKDRANGDGDNLHLRRIWAQGDYNNLQMKFGKFNVSHDHDISMLFDDHMSGAEVTVGPKQNGINVKVAAGRVNFNNDSKFDNNFQNPLQDNVANLQLIGVNYNRQKFDAYGYYYHLTTDSLKRSNFAKQNPYVADFKYANGDTDTANIWELAANYRFDRNWRVIGAYAQNTEADIYDKAWFTQVNYKGSEPANPGTWGAWLGYKHLGANVAFDTNEDDAGYNQKGWVMGADYVLMHNTVVTARYFNGKDLYNNANASQIWGRIQFYF